MFSSTHFINDVKKAEVCGLKKVKQEQPATESTLHRNTEQHTTKPLVVTLASPDLAEDLQRCERAARNNEKDNHNDSNSSNKSDDDNNSTNSNQDKSVKWRFVRVIKGSGLCGTKTTTTTTTTTTK